MSKLSQTETKSKHSSGCRPTRSCFHQMPTTTLLTRFIFLTLHLYLYLYLYCLLTFPLFPSNSCNFPDGLKLNSTLWRLSRSPSNSLMEQNEMKAFQREELEEKKWIREKVSVLNPTTCCLLVWFGKLYGSNNEWRKFCPHCVSRNMSRWSELTSL